MDLENYKTPTSIRNYFATVVLDLNDRLRHSLECAEIFGASHLQLLITLLVVGCVSEVGGSGSLVVMLRVRAPTFVLLSAVGSCSFCAKREDHAFSVLPRFLSPSPSLTLSLSFGFSSCYLLVK